MAQKVFNIIIKLLKEGGADKETISGLVDIKNAMVAGMAIAGGLAVAYKTVDKVLDETVGKFAAYATEVDVFKSALSTTAEEGSRLIQVADDFGISAEGMQTAMFRAVKEGMEPTIEGLAGMADEYNALATPQEKADYLVKNFGKSSQELTRLLGEGGQAIRDRAAAVSDSLVMDEAAIQKARDYAFAQDALNDSIDGFKIAVGEKLIPTITAGIKSMTDGATANQLYTRAMELGIDVGRNMGTGMVAVNGVLVDQTELLRLVKIAEEEAADAAYYLAGGDDEASRAAGKLAGLTQDLTTDMTNYAGQLSAVSALGGIFTQQTEDMDAALQNVKLAQEGYDAALVSGTGLDIAKTKLGEAQKAVEDLEAAQQTQTDTWMLNCLTQALGVGGITSAEMAFLLQYQTDTGLITPEAAARAQAQWDSAMRMVEGFNAARDAANGITGALNGIPTDVTSTVNIVTHEVTYYDTYTGQVVGGPTPTTATPMEKGGDFWVKRPTLFLAGEAGPERATFTPQGNAPANAPETGRLASAVASQTGMLRSIQSALEDLPGQFAAEIQKRM